MLFSNQAEWQTMVRVWLTGTGTPFFVHFKDHVDVAMGLRGSGLQISTTGGLIINGEPKQRVRDDRSLAAATDGCAEHVKNMPKVDILYVSLSRGPFSSIRD